MAVVINTNSAATKAASNLAHSSAMLRRSLVRLSSGRRIVNPSDDAGGLAVSIKLSSAARRSAAVNDNVANTTSYLQQQDGVLAVTSKILGRISELWTLYQDETKSSTDRSTYDVEYQDLQKELQALTGETFNGRALFGSSGAGVVELVRVSEDGAQAIAIGAKDLASSSAGVGALADGDGGGTLAGLTLGTLDTAVGNVASMRADNGAEQSMLSFAGEVLTTNQANLESAYSRIVDVDIAEESTQLAHWDILVQSGAAMLAQAHQSAQSALRLIE